MLVELDLIAGRVVEEDLAAHAFDGQHVADIDAESAELRGCIVDVVDGEGEVGTAALHERQLDEMELLRADPKPAAADPQFGPVELGESQLVDVERSVGFDVVDVDGDVVDTVVMHRADLSAVTANVCDDGAGGADARLPDGDVPAGTSCHCGWACSQPAAPQPGNRHAPWSRR